MPTRTDQFNEALREKARELEYERNSLRDDRNRLGAIVYNGPQPGKPWGCFTDPVTGSTFAIQDGETILVALNRLRIRYGEVQP